MGRSSGSGSGKGGLIGSGSSPGRGMLIAHQQDGGHETSPMFALTMSRTGNGSAHAVKPFARRRPIRCAEFGQAEGCRSQNGGEPDREDAPHGQIFLRPADRSNLFGVIVSDLKRAETRKMATKKKPGKRGWKQGSSKPQSASLMERLAALPQQQANENERTGRTQRVLADEHLS